MSKNESWSTQREALAVEALRGSGHLRLQVSGESMLPTLWPGDIAEIEACSLEELGRGEIVLAFRDGRFFLHRFLAQGRSGFVTRGDSMPGIDPEFRSDALLGRLVTANRNGQEITLRPQFWTRLAGLVFCYFGAARRAALSFRSGSTRVLPAVDPGTA